TQTELGLGGKLEPKPAILLVSIVRESSPPKSIRNPSRRPPGSHRQRLNAGVPRSSIHLSSPVRGLWKAKVVVRVLPAPLRWRKMLVVGLRWPTSFPSARTSSGCSWAARTAKPLRRPATGHGCCAPPAAPSPGTSSSKSKVRSLRLC
uniref:Uncharacterized protein n=1 Tax=Triticum urartu TaxID=4572 RepID=A0A8R7PGT8_TRIUA